MKSIRIRLSVYLLLAAVFTASVSGLMTYLRTIGESEQLFDYQLRQIAQSLRDQGDVANMASPFRSEDSALDVVVQIWTIDGRIAYLSHPDNPLPDRATLGYADVEAGDKRWRVFSMGAKDRIIQVAQPLELRRGRAVAAALRSLTPLFVFTPLMALLIWWLVGNSLQPLKRLSIDLRERNERILDDVSAAGVPSEIAPLISSLNSLLSRLRKAFSSQQAFIADAAHELRSPMAALTLQLQLVERARDAASKAQALEKLHEGIDRSARLIEQLISAARADPNDTTVVFSTIDLAELVRQVIAEAFVFAQAREISIELNAAEHVMLEADATGLRVLARNLIDNAIRYTPMKGMVRASIESSDEKVLLAIEDSGFGIAPENRARAFDRFYRLEQSDQSGSGLGLAIVKSIVEQHDAKIMLDSSTLGGLKALVTFARTPNCP